MPSVLVAGLLACLVLGLLNVPSPAEAARAESVPITRVVSSRIVLAGDSVRVHGRVGRLATGSRVALQRATTHGWRTVGWTRTGAAGRYSFTARLRSPHWFRVYSPRHPRRLAGVSSPVQVRTVGCAGMRRPAATTAWFAAPAPRRPSPLARHLSQLVCSAAPGATIDIAMYFISSRTPDADLIVSSLRQVHRYRHVRVNIMVEGLLYSHHSALARSLRKVSRFAHVHSCDRGCHDQRPSGPSPSIMHEKFMRISDTVWRPGADPVVMISSANWSRSQLRDKWQSAVLVYDDQRLNTVMRAQWQMLEACSSKAGCGSWNRHASPPGIGHMHDVGGLWFGSSTEYLTDPGRGLGVSFTPEATGDPVAHALNDFTCTPQHHTVRVAHAFITHARFKVMLSLARLAADGCDVRVVIARPGNVHTLTGIQTMTRSGVSVGCVSLVHDKLILVDAVRRSTSMPDQMVLMGSESLSGTALHRNDEATLRLGTATASGAALRANHRVFEDYLQHWTAINRHRGSCSVPR